MIANKIFPLREPPCIEPRHERELENSAPRPISVIFYREAISYWLSVPWCTLNRSKKKICVCRSMILFEEMTVGEDCFDCSIVPLDLLGHEFCYCGLPILGIFSTSVLLINFWHWDKLFVIATLLLFCRASWESTSAFDLLVALISSTNSHGYYSIYMQST